MSEQIIAVKRPYVKGRTPEDRKQRRAEEGKRYRLKYKEKLSQKSKEWEARNLEWAKARRHAHYIANKEKYLARAKKRSAEKPKEVRICQKKYVEKHRDIIRQRHREWCEANPERVQKSRAKWFDKNRDKARAASDRYGKTPKGRAVSKNSIHRRRARIKSANLPAPPNDQLQALLERAKNCHYCEKPFTKQRKRTIDHIVAIANGGTHVMDNLCVSCRSCNSKKHAKDPLDFARQIGRLLI